MMTQDIIYSLKTNPSGTRIVWKDDSVGVKVLFHRDGTQLTASAVTFDGEKFDSASASRWLANRISQYALNSQITNLTPYEDALLASLVAYKPEFMELATRYKDTPAMTTFRFGTNMLFDWNSFCNNSEGKHKIIASNKESMIINKEIKVPKELKPIIDGLVSQGLIFVSCTQNIDIIEILLTKDIYQLRITQNSQGKINISYYKQIPSESHYIDNVSIDELSTKLSKLISSVPTTGILNSKNEIWNVSKQIERKMKSAKVGSVDA